MAAEKNTVKIPAKGIPRHKLLAEMQSARKDDLKWQLGKSFCLIYYPGKEKADLIQEAYTLFFNENALNPVSFPSLKRFENEVVKMVANLLNGNEKTAGTMTSGGTESILMAVKSARDYFEKEKPGKRPEIILPASAHPAFNKACQYFKVKAVTVPIDQNFRADIDSVKNAINENTIMLVGSAPAYPHGVIDPLKALSDLAIQHHLLFHVDACIGGMFLPFAEKLGHPVPLFDFRLPGVSSISVDLHKFGYAAKGASVVLYRDPEIRKKQFYIHTNWPGGIYGSTGITGSKSGGAIAAAWAALMGIGQNGYLELTERTLRTTGLLKESIARIEGLKILGNPDMSIIAFSSEKLNMYEIADELNIKGWHFERLQFPPAIHLTVSQIHEEVYLDFLADLRLAVAKAGKVKLRNIASNLQIATVKRLVKLLPNGILAKVQAQLAGSGSVKKTRTAPLYGMMGALSGTDDLDEIVLDLLDKLNK